MNKARFYKVKSFTSPDVVYTVRCMPNGEWRCSCPRFVFNDKTPCKHIKRIKKRLVYQKKYRKSKAGLASKRGWYDKNIEEIREYNRIYYQENRDRIKAQRLRRKEGQSKSALA